MCSEVVNAAFIRPFCPSPAFARSHQELIVQSCVDINHERIQFPWLNSMR